MSRQAADEDEAAASARAAAAALAAQIDEAGREAATRREQRPELSRERDQAREAGRNSPPSGPKPTGTAGPPTTRAPWPGPAPTPAVRRRRTSPRRWSIVELFEEASQLRRARIDGMRAELAATLVDGAPCPVCGSLDHPELCELRGERVTRDQEEAADAEAAQASERAEMVGAKLAAADVLVNDLSGRLADAGFAVATT